MRLTDDDLDKSVGGILSRFGINKDEARKARQELDSRIAAPVVRVEPEDDDERYHVYFTGGFTQVDNSVDDLLAPTLTAVEQSIYRRLYRLSFGYGLTWCSVSHPDLGRQCNISARSTVQKGIQGLIEKGCIKVIEPPVQHKPQTYRVYLPCEMPQFREEETVAGVIMMKEKCEASEVRSTINSSMDFSRLKNRPLKIGSLDELRRMIPGRLDSKNRRLNSGRQGDEGNDRADPQPQKNEKKPFKNNIKNKEDLKTTTEEAFVVVSSSEFFRELPDAVVKDLCTEFGPARVAEKIRGLDEQYKGKEIENPGGLLREALRKDYVPPKHVARRHRAKELKEKQEAADEEIHKQEEELRKQILEVKAKLNKAERAKLRKQALREIEKGNYKQEFVTEHLIEAVENGILGRDM